MVTRCPRCGALHETTEELANIPLWANSKAHWCPKCLGLPDYPKLPSYIPIERPNDLFLIANILKELIKNGSISQTNGSIGYFGSELHSTEQRRIEIFDIVRGEPWPSDIIEMEFLEHATGYKFKLTCETYHGSGGALQKITEAEEPSQTPVQVKTLLTDQRSPPRRWWFWRRR